MSNARYKLTLLFGTALLVSVSVYWQSKRRTDFPLDKTLHAVSYWTFDVKPQRPTSTFKRMLAYVGVDLLLRMMTSQGNAEDEVSQVSDGVSVEETNFRLDASGADFLGQLTEESELSESLAEYQGESEGSEDGATFWVGSCNLGLCEISDTATAPPSESGLRVPISASAFYMGFDGQVDAIPRAMSREELREWQAKCGQIPDQEIPLYRSPFTFSPGTVDVPHVRNIADLMGDSEEAALIDTEEVARAAVSHPCNPGGIMWVELDVATTAQYLLSKEDPTYIDPTRLQELQFQILARLNYPTAPPLLLPDNTFYDPSAQVDTHSSHCAEQPTESSTPSPEGATE